MVGLTFMKAQMLVAGWFSRGRKPIQVRADILRAPEPSTSQPIARGFAALPGERPPAPAGGEPGWRDADLKRAIRIARKSGLRAYRVEIDAEGTIAIIVAEDGAAVPDRGI